MSYHALGSWLTEGPATQMFQQAMIQEYKKDPSKTDVKQFLIEEGLLNPTAAKAGMGSIVWILAAGVLVLVLLKKKSKTVTA